MPVHERHREPALHRLSTASRGGETHGVGRSMECVHDGRSKVLDFGNDVLHTTVRAHPKPHWNFRRHLECHAGIGVERQRPGQEPGRFVARGARAPTSPASASGLSSATSGSAAITTGSRAGRFGNSHGWTERGQLFEFVHRRMWRHGWRWERADRGWPR